MKRFIFAYIAFACVFLFLYSFKPKYETDQVGTLIEFIPTSKIPTNCTGETLRPYVYMYQRPDKSTYYLCTKHNNYPQQTYLEKYPSTNERLIKSFIVAFVIGLVVFYIKPFVHYLNTN